jgi:hypothetical protein
VNLSAWLQELGGLDTGDGRDRAHLGTLRHRLLMVPARLVRHAWQTTLRLPPGRHLLAPSPGPTTPPAHLDLTTRGPPPAPTQLMETSEPGASRDTGMPTRRNTTPSIGRQRCEPIMPPLSVDPGLSIQPEGARNLSMPMLMSRRAWSG